MQEHVGKKRRKEIRQASELRQTRNKAYLRCGGFFSGIVVIIIIYTVFTIFGVIDATSMINQVILMIIAFAGCMLIGNESSKAYDAHKKYKAYCEQLNVSTEEVKAYDKGGK